jgi:Mg-chelatase subunit ChlD
MSFRIEAFQNRYLSPGQRRVDGILQVTSAAGAGGSGAAQQSQLVVGFIIDKSGSMAGERIEAVRQAVIKAIRMLDERAWFFVVAFDATSQVVVPDVQWSTGRPTRAPALQATAANKEAAARAVKNLTAGGGTAMSTGLAAARDIFALAPTAIREAIFLTDGKNESETKGKVDEELAQCEGLFECDCWGVGTDWRVGEVQQIAQGLLGKASLIPDPNGIEDAFKMAMEQASAKALKDVRLRLWTPQGATLAFVKQVNPTIDELTTKAKVISPQVREYMTGAWAAGEARDFHVGIDVRQGAVGDEMLAGRPSVVYSLWNGTEWTEVEEKPAEARLFANWTGDDSLSSRIDHHVAHYTGQDDLANAIQKGLELRAAGDASGATQMLGRAVKIAHASHNTEMTHRLSKVVDVVDAGSGTIRLKKDVQKVATMELELESRTTKRVARKAESP